MSNDEVAASLLPEMNTASANLTPRGIPLNFHIPDKTLAPKASITKRPATPAAIPSAYLQPLQTVIVTTAVEDDLPPLLDSPVNIGPTKKGPCRLTCELNRMPVYVYIDAQGVEYIGIEKLKGLRGAFNDDHRRQFELEINDITNDAGHLVKIKRSAVDGLEVYKTHNNLLRVNDLEGVMRSKFSGFLPREITAILDDFTYSMHSAEQLGDKTDSPELDDEAKPTKRAYRKKRDREEADNQINESNAILMETVLRLEAKVDQLSQDYKETVRDNELLKDVLEKVSRHFDVRLAEAVKSNYQRSDEWKNRKIELEARVTIDTRQRVEKEFHNNEVPKLTAAVKTEVAKAELERIKKLLQQ